ncbi:hypothetical protein IO46_06395 [Gallibacterium anatis]|uniref:Uncharacterized protein n=1 Tax=Gallibacterium anatis 12656/12 TaxID=1195244 RepID=U1H3S7_9PAST|nr:hypothetical protein N561_03090 [Gallibacterium anatis 12656/12]KGQ36008.1 hypothetical protein JP34_00535 [Gallibacterium anatis]KGQ57004.1 hypothetical protein IO44_00325 [Gallibacterium anatis str. Avicor]KGQ46741.1 hypothetical protein JP29_02760 [Gallibacterium anatis]KGQ51476.1 hypothetical protein JL04_01295 [Gallibacterium anatis]
MYLTILKPIMGGMFSYLCVAILMENRDKEIGYKSTTSEIIKISILFTLFSHIFFYSIGRDDSYFYSYINLIFNLLTMPVIVSIPVILICYFRIKTEGRL